MADWQVARLIPTWGINSDTEAEMRATSSMLAVMSVVRDFSSALLTPLGAPSAQRAQVETFIEVALKLTDGTVVRPDGLVRVSYGKRTYVALIEVKTGDNQLQADQVNSYWEAARQFGYDAVITISNEMAVSGRHPTDGLKVRANSKVQVHHLSWTRILTTAVMCKVHRGVEDVEQAWLLGELIRYLESPASGAMAFTDMGRNWVAVRDGARSSTLRKTAPEVKDIAQRWDQLIRYTALTLGAQIGADVQQVFPRSQQDSKARVAHLVDSLCDTGLLDGAIKVPHAVGPIGLLADLRAKQVVATVDVPAPTDRGSKARTTWLLRQLTDEAPSRLSVEAWARNAREPLAATLDEVRQSRELLEHPDGREILRYRLVLRGEAGAARKAGGKTPGFVDSVIDLLDTFYGSVVQGITPWVPKAPQLRTRKEVEPTSDSEVPDSRVDAEEALEDAVETAGRETRIAAPDEPSSDHAGADPDLVTSVPEPERTAADARIDEPPPRARPMWPPASSPHTDGDNATDSWP